MECGAIRTHEYRELRLQCQRCRILAFDRWIKSELQKTTGTVTANIEAYGFDHAAKRSTILSGMSTAIGIELSKATLWDDDAALKPKMAP